MGAYYKAWPLNESEAGVDLVLIETSLVLLCEGNVCAVWLRDEFKT